MKQLINIIQIGFLLAISSAWSNQEAGDIDCDQTWQQLASKIVSNHSNIESLKAKWVSLKPQCGDSGLYTFRLSSMLIKLKQYKEAVDLLSSKVASNYKDQEFILLGLTTVFSNKWTNNNNEDDLKAAEEYALKLVELKPNWSISHEELGNIQLLKHDFKNSAESFEKAINLGEATLSSYRNGVIANYQLEQYPKAVNLGELAVSQYEQLLLDFNFVLNLSMACVETQKFEIAEKLLLQLREFKPEVEQNAQFRQAVNYLLDSRGQQ